jgi:hypothetical protein
MAANPKETLPNAVGLKTQTIPVTLELAGPVKGARDERTGQELGQGSAFSFNWSMNRAIVFSFEGGPPRNRQ